jgi:uncharacterized protein (DUF4415 family)
VSIARQFAPQSKPIVEPAEPRKRGRPSVGKEQVTIRLDKDVLAKWKATGAGWQSRINEVLRKANPCSER